jgi:hypothetical protein
MTGDVNRRANRAPDPTDMFIETESTPNPATLKFLPGLDVMGGRGTADFTSAAEAMGAARSPRASSRWATSPASSSATTSSP